MTFKLMSLVFFLIYKIKKGLLSNPLWLVEQNCNSQNHGEAVYEIRSLSAVWNQHEVLNVINPKEDTR